MNKDEILVMKAGRELDYAVAEAMGNKIERMKCFANPLRDWEVSPNGTIREPRLYSTDISAAWPIAEKMGLGLFPLNNKDWACCKASYIYHMEIGQDHYADPNIVICRAAPEAICKAALLTRLDEIKKLEVKA